MKNIIELTASIALIQLVTTFWINNNSTENLFENDIILESDDLQELTTVDTADSSLQNAALRSRNNLWPNGRIPYRISNEFTSIEKLFIENIMLEFHHFTCVTFHERDLQPHYVFIVKGRTCKSGIGYQHTVQKLYLAMHCLNRNDVLHELMHAIGFFHEQSRHDRDEHVTIIMKNVRKGFERNFNKQPVWYVTHVNTSYDYQSIMHYPPDAFSTYGQLTILANIPGVEIKAVGLSEIDKIDVNRLYNCTTDYKCLKLKEPKGTTDDKCLKLKELKDYVNSDTCEFNLTADSKPRYIQSHPYYGLSEYNNNMFCKWTIRGSDLKQVFLLMDAFILEKYNETCSNDYLEIYNSVDVQYNRKWCGNLSEDSLWGAISTLDLFHLYLHTDSSRTFAGFQMLYFIATLKEAVSCGATMIAGDNVALIKSHPFNQEQYSNDLSCSWTIVAGEEKHVKIMMSVFNLEFETDCKYDYLEIFDGHNNAGNKIGKYCGTKIKRVVQSNTRALHFKFTTDSATTNTGFWFAYFATI